MIHICTIAFFSGIVAIGNLRVLGWALRRLPYSQTIGPFRVWKWLSFAILFVTGTLIALSDPVEYYGNAMFWLTLVVLIIAGWNAAAFRYGIYQTISEWDQAPVAPPAARRWAKTSLFLWIALVFIGRATAFF